MESPTPITKHREPPKLRGWECPSCKYRWTTAADAKPPECPMCGRKRQESHAAFMRRRLRMGNGKAGAVKRMAAVNMDLNRQEDGGGPGAA